ncbi:MAG: DUF2442 domain-containing protein [Proteobacteria bacterium]|nr:DUF2442 domain-containing protein [Pseudomonadota bacterium]
MAKFINLVSVQALPNYSLALEFEDGVKKVFDFKPELALAPFAPLKDIALFNRATATSGGVVWNDDIDISAEYLYDNGILVNRPKQGRGERFSRIHL